MVSKKRRKKWTGSPPGAGLGRRLRWLGLEEEASDLLQLTRLLLAERARVPPGEQQKTTRWRRTKRALQKADPDNWKRIWREHVRPNLQREERRQREDPWGTVWLLKPYLGAVDMAIGRPQWGVIAELLNLATESSDWTAARLRREWPRHARGFEPWNAEAFLIGQCRVMLHLKRGDQGFQEFLARAVTVLDRCARNLVVDLYCDKGWSVEQIVEATALTEQTVKDFLAEGAGVEAAKGALPKRLG